MKEYIKELIIKAHTRISKNVEDIIRREILFEENPYARIQYENMLNSIEISKRESLPICQDTGIHYFYIKTSGEFPLKHLINTIRQAIEELEDGILRENTMHPISKKIKKGYFTYDVEIIPEDYLEIIYFPRGAGVENVSSTYILEPNSGINDIINIICEDVKSKAVKACPPIVLGIGIGGDFSTAVRLSRKALIRGLTYNKDFEDIEREIEERINCLNIGPMGIGGRVTCLKVNIEVEPCHIASIPLAISYSCWPYRKSSLIYDGKKYMIK